MYFFFNYHFNVFSILLILVLKVDSENERTANLVCVILVHME